MLVEAASNDKLVLVVVIAGGAVYQGIM